MGIAFYCGINETKWNYHPVTPGRYACISPVMGSKESTRKENAVRVPSNTEIIQDSGAFCDGPGSRLSFQDALDRQIRHAEKYAYSEMITHRASYDLLIDEKWENGIRSKSRWSESDAEKAVDETIRAAEFLAAHRNGINLILSAQGVSPEQYLRCSREIIPMLQPEDIFGMGGWCIIGRLRKKMMPVFEETISGLFPLLQASKISKAHIWGVVFAEASGKLLWMGNHNNVKLSTDSSGPQKRPAFGLWGYADWIDSNYQRPPVEIRGLERARHVETVRSWLDTLESTKYYKPPVYTFRKETLKCSIQPSIWDPSSWLTSLLQDGVKQQ